MMLDDAEEGQLKGPIVVLAPYSMVAVRWRRWRTGMGTNSHGSASRATRWSPMWC
jgi:hypothetical protein